MYSLMRFLKLNIAAAGGPATKVAGPPAAAILSNGTPSRRRTLYGSPNFFLLNFKFPYALDPYFLYSSVEMAHTNQLLNFSRDIYTVFFIMNFQICTFYTISTLLLGAIFETSEVCLEIYL